MEKRWKKEDETYLKRYAKSKRLVELAERFHTDTETVQTQLSAMGLAAKDSVAPVRLQDDPLVPEYAKALKALHSKKWSEARELFSNVVGSTDRPELADRARRFVQVCEDHLAKDGGEVDPFLAAVYEHNRGNYDQALALCAGKDQDERFTYLAAAIHAMKGDATEASQLLAQAIELNPKNRIHAYHDTDFVELKGIQEYAHLFRQP